MECDRIVVHSFNSCHTVSTYRVAKLSQEYLNTRQTIEERLRTASLVSEGGRLPGYLDGHGAQLSGRQQGNYFFVDFS